MSAECPWHESTNNHQSILRKTWKSSNWSNLEIYCRQNWFWKIINTTSVRIGSLNPWKLKHQVSLFYKSSRPHFLLVYQRYGNNPLSCWENIGKVCNSLAFSSLFGNSCSVLLVEKGPQYFFMRISIYRRCSTLNRFLKHSSSFSLLWKKNIKLINL